MSFLFPSWDTAFSPAFHEDAKGMLEAALNKGNKPPVIQGRIEVVELSMGKEPPTLTLLEIGDLSLDRFRGILRLGYQGDAWLEVRCRVQANPLSHNPNLNPSSTLPLSTPLLASQPLLVPMTLRLSKLHLRAILILVVSKAKGITLVFKNDPLQNVDVSSTFDSVEVIRGYLQQEIEGQLREMFREDLPGIIHRLSQRWFTGTGVGGKVELQYKEQSDPSPSPQTPHDHLPLDDQEDDVFTQRPIFPPPVPSISPSVTPSKKKPPLTRIRRSSTAASESPTSYTVFPEIEEYDPTYGLRPEGVPSHSGYEAFGRLWEKARQGEGKGLGALMSISSAIQEKQEYRGDVSDGEDDYEDDGTRSFDMVEMEESLQSLKSPHLSRRNSRRSTIGDEDRVEWEMFPAVGGGVITRPRVYHSQSLIRAPSESGGNGIQPSPSGTATGGSITARASSIGGASSTIGSMRHPSAPVSPMTAFRPNALAGPGPSSLRRLVTTRSDVFQGHRATRSDVVGMGPNARSNNGNLSRRQSAVGTASSAARTSGSSWDTAPTRSNTLSTRATSAAPSSKPVSIDSKLLSPARNGATRDRSGSIAGTSPGKSFPPRQITLLPINNSVSQLATLSHSAHTLSPYARGHEHIAVRSFPHLGKTPMGYPHSNGFGSSGNLSAIAEGGQSQVRAHRKRIYHLGKKRQEDLGSDEPLSPDIDQFSPSARRPNERLENTNPERFPPSAYRVDVFDDSSPDKTSSSQVRTASLSGSRSTNSHSAHLTMQRKDKRPMSLTGTAQRVMAEDNGVRRGLATASVNSPRPNMSRSMDTRTSYGFPTLKGM